jgi:hypothetical protein
VISLLQNDGDSFDLLCEVSKLLSNSKVEL